MTHTFTATLTGARKDILWTPKTLFTNIQFEDGTLFRAHCWIEEHKKRIQPYIPANIQSPSVTIQFTAKIEDYQSSHGVKQRLVHIRNVQQI